MHHRNCRSLHGSFFGGMIIVAVGIIFLLKSMGIIAPEIHFSDYWPLLLIIIGLVRTISPHSSDSYFWGPVLIITGGLFLAHNLHYFTFPIQKLWPVIPIIIGLKIMLRPVFRTGSAQEFVVHHHRNHCHHSWNMNPEITDDNVAISLVLSGGKYVYTGKQFKGGFVSATLAGCEIDLTKVETELDTIPLDVNLVMGGIELRVPENWSVTYIGTPFMGSFDNKSRSPAMPVKKLVIRGTITLAGIEVKN